MIILMNVVNIVLVLISIFSCILITSIVLVNKLIITM